jgi:hypothetical protein
MLRRVLLLPLLLVSTTLSAAQATPLQPHQRVAWKYVSPYVFGRAEVGRFFPYGGRSVALQWGGDVVMSFSPISHDSCPIIAWDTEGPVTAFAVLPAAEDDDRDELLISNSEGLWRVRALDPQDDGDLEFTKEFLTSAGNEARDLVCTDLDDDGDTDVAFVDSIGEKIHLLIASGSSLTEVPTIPAAGEIVDIESIRWDTADPAPELAVLSTWGTEVRSLTGLQLWARISLHDEEHCMAVVAPPSGSPPSEPDQLVVAQPNANGVQFLTRFWATGNQSAISLGQLGVISMDAGDYDGDGDEDLALGLTSLLTVRVLWSDQGVFTPANHHDQALGEPPTQAVPANRAQVCLEDLDDDGVADLFAACNDQDCLAVVRGGGGFANLGGGGCSSPVYQLYDARSTDLSSVYPSTNGSIWPVGSGGVELEIANAWGNLTALNPSGNYVHTHLELILWGIENAESDWWEDGVSVVALMHALYRIPSEAESGFRTGADPVYVGFGLDKFGSDASPATFSARYYVEIRPVRWSGTSVLNPLTSHCGGFTYSLGNSIDELLDNDGSTCEIPLAINGVVQPLQLTNNARGWVNQPRTPPKQRPKVLPILESPPRITDARPSGGNLSPASASPPPRRRP